jgi:hypothetical protein
MKNYSTWSLVFIFTVSLVFTGCFQMFGPGPATKIKAVYNPTKTMQAILFVKGGNATETDSYQVSVKSSNDVLDSVEVGNAFTVDDNHGKTRLNVNSINFKWITPKQLVIDYDKNLRTFFQVNDVSGITIKYLPR